MSITKKIHVNDGSDRRFQDNTVGEMVLDTTPQVGSFNGVTSDGVAKAISGASGEVPVVNPGDAGKVLTAGFDGDTPTVSWEDAGSGVPEYSTSDDGKVLGVVDNSGTAELQWVAPATVDQTYDASSTNAQSGVAVAEAIGSVNQVPGADFSDAGKVLTVGPSAAPEWVEPQGTEYAAGDGISIENDTVSAVVSDGGGLMLSGPTVRGTYVYASNSVVFNVGDNPDTDAEAFISLDVGVGVQVYFIGNRDAAYPVLVLYSTTDSSSYAVCSRSLYGAMEMNGPSYVYALSAGNYTMRGRMSDLFGNNWTDLIDSDGNINMCLCATDTLDGTTLWGTGTGPGGSVSASSFGSNSCPVEITSSIVGKVGIALFDAPIPTDTIRFKFASATKDPTTDSDLNNLAGTWTRVSHIPNVWDYTERTTSMSSRFNGKFTANGINVDILGANLLTPTNLASLFYRCTGILSVANFKVGPTVNAGSMFYQCENVATVGINIGVSNAASMFNKCYKLTDVTGSINFRTSGSAASMCESCSKLKAITWGRSNITSLASAFKNCSSLTEIPLTNWSGSTFTSTFENCTSLTTIPYINMNNASSGADMSNMFKGCTRLMYLGTLYGGGATNFTSAFEGCTGLLTMPTISATPTNVSSMFKGCTRVLGGAPQLYQQFASQATPPATTTDCFTDCGSGSTVGAADLAQIPSSWGGTGA